MKWRVYIIGKVGNGSVELTNEEYQIAFNKFRRVEKELLNAGFEVRNPMNYVPRDIPSWADAMKIVIPELCKCNAAYLIHDFKQSKGGTIEYNLANDLGYRLITPEVVANQLKENKDKHIFKPQTTTHHV